jgi:UDP-glucose 4-epimerase
MKCLVTGGLGFIGSHLVDELIKKNYKVTIIDKNSPKKKLNEKIKFIKTDLLNEKKIEKAIKYQDIVFHFGGLSGINESISEPLKTAEYNIIGTIKLLKFSLKYKINRFIFASSVYVNSEQGSFYKSSKRAAEDFIEEYHKKYKLDFTILRFGTVYGTRASRENTIDKIINLAIKKKKIIYKGNKRNIREFINVKDAAKATLKVINKKYANKYIQITGNKKTSVVNALKIIKNELGLNTRIVYDNRKEEGHYIKSPETFKIKKAKKINLGKNIPFNLGIREIIREKKK